jgi:hypothetical protein
MGGSKNLPDLISQVELVDNVKEINPIQGQVL